MKVIQGNFLQIEAMLSKTSPFFSKVFVSQAR